MVRRFIICSPPLVCYLFPGDIVIWDRDPLTIGALPTDVFINGVRKCCDHVAPVSPMPTHLTLSLRAAQVISPPLCPGLNTELTLSDGYVVRAPIVRTQNPLFGGVPRCSAVIC